MARRSKENAIDWDAIHRQFRLGTKSNQQLSKEFGVAASTIGRRAEKDGWVADKKPEVDALTNSLLIQSAAGNANPNATPSAFQIKAAGQANADLVLQHRADLKELRELETRMTEILRDAIAVMPMMDRFCEQLTRAADGDAKAFGMLYQMLTKLLTRSVLIDDLKRLGETGDRRRNAERVAFGLDNEENKVSEIDALLMRAGALEK